MTKEYEIKYEPVNIDGLVKDKYNIYYYVNDVLEVKEFHSTDGVNGIIKDGYTLKQS